jgi:ribonuclease P protein component
VLGCAAQASVDRKHRLTRDADFKLVRAEGKSSVHRLVVLYARPNGSSVTRVGFSVGKRVGKAVVRNRSRRRLREVVRPLFVRMQPGWDLVLIARGAIVEASFQEVRSAVEQVFRRAGLFVSPPV